MVKRGRNRAIARLAATALVPAVILAVGAWWFVADSLREVYQKRQQHAQTLDIERTEVWLETQVATASADAVALARQTERLLDDVDPARMPPLSALYEAFSTAKPSYSQVRLLSPAGREVVRINRGPGGTTVVPPAALQDKSDRPYVQRGLATSSEAWVSRIDLNVENGQVVTPHESTLRVVAPVRAGGAVKGLVVLNLRGELLLQHLRRTPVNGDSALWLLDASGTWMAGPSPDSDWGGTLPERADQTLGAAFPGAWAAIQAGSSGHTLTPLGLFTFRRLEVALAAQTLDGPSMEAEGSWTVVAYVPTAGLIPPWWTGALAVLGLGLAALAYVSWRWADARVHRDLARALVEDNEVLQRVMSTMQDGIIMTDEAGTIRYWSPAATLIFGWNSSEALGRQVHEMLALPEMRPRADERLRSFASTGTGPRVGRLRDLTAIRKGGERFTVEIGLSSALVGGETWAVGTVRDITERKAMEDALQRHHEELEALIEARTTELTETNAELRSEVIERRRTEAQLRESEQRLVATQRLARLGTWELDPRTGALRWSDEVFRILRMPVAAGPPSLDQFLETVHEEDRGGLRSAMERLVAEGTPYSLDVRHLRRDGSTVFTASRGSSDAERGSRVWGSIMDITARKAGEAELLRAREAADAANKAKSAFLASMSHEIRTPINAIVGMTQLALDTELTPRQHQHLTTVDASSRTLLALVDDILDFSKIEAGRLELNPAPFSLSAALEELTATFRPSVVNTAVELIVITADDVPSGLHGDLLRLRQVLLNLLGNAFKFTEQGEIVLRVEVVAPEAPSAGAEVWVRFSIADTGIGIAREMQSRLFQPFVQATTTTTRLYGGTGLGLAICERLVRLMGGRMGVRSELGQGAKFWFEAPFGVGAEAVAPLEAPGDLRGRRVLVVEDSPGTQELLGTLLRRMSLVPEVVGSAESALALLDASTHDAPALLLVDWALPGMDALSLAQALRERDDTRSTPLVLMSAFAGLGEEERARELGVEQLLLKPITPSTLFDAIAGAVHDPRRRRAAGPPRPTRTALDGWHILIAEDNEANRLVVCETLHAMGATTEVSITGAEALERVLHDAGRFNAVLMDIQMPVMDGLAATRAIRAALPELRLPIVALTANAMSGDREECLSSGADDYLSKPIDRARLLATLLRVGTGPGVGSPAAQGRSTDAGAPSDPDIEGARRRIGLAPAPFRRILRIFLDAEPPLVDQLHAAAGRGDQAAASQLAHSLAGAAADIGATSMMRAAQAIEAAAQNGGVSVEQLQWLRAASDDTFLRVREHLREQDGA